MLPKPALLTAILPFHHDSARLDILLIKSLFLLKQRYIIRQMDNHVVRLAVSQLKGFEHFPEQQLCAFVRDLFFDFSCRIPTPLTGKLPCITHERPAPVTWRGPLPSGVGGVSPPFTPRPLLVTQRK